MCGGGGGTVVVSVYSSSGSSSCSSKLLSIRRFVFGKLLRSPYRQQQKRASKHSADQAHSIE